MVCIPPQHRNDLRENTGQGHGRDCIDLGRGIGQQNNGRGFEKTGAGSSRRQWMPVFDAMFPGAGRLHSNAYLLWTCSVCNNHVKCSV